MWRTKERKIDETTERLAKAINKNNCSNLVSTANSTYRMFTLPFYPNFKLYTFIDFSFCPYLEMNLLDNGSYTFVLDGSQKPFLEANALSPLVLTSNNVYQYASVVLGNICKGDSSYRLVNSINDITFSSIPSKDQFNQIESSIISPVIKKNEDHFLITTSLLLRDNILETTIKIHIDGRIDIIEENVVLENMPIQELVLE